MFIVNLSESEVQELIESLTGHTPKYEVLMAYDPIDGAIKVKTNGQSWGRPLGHLDERYGG